MGLRHEMNIYVMTLKLNLYRTLYLYSVGFSIIRLPGWRENKDKDFACLQ